MVAVSSKRINFVKPRQIFQHIGIGLTATKQALYGLKVIDNPQPPAMNHNTARIPADIIRTAGRIGSVATASNGSAPNLSNAGKVRS